MSSSRVERAGQTSSAPGTTTAPADVVAAEAGSLHIGSPDDLAARYRRGVQAGDVRTLVRLFRPDALVDTHVPNWRFQLQGSEAAAERACVLPRPGRFTVFDTEPTDHGVLVQFEWHQGESQTVVRQLHWWRLVDGRIDEQVVFCAGVWDRRLQALMEAKAPLVRP